MIKNRNKTVLVYIETLRQGNGLNKFRSIVSEVSSFVGNSNKNENYQHEALLK